MCDIPANPGGDADVYCKCRAERFAEHQAEQAELKRKIHVLIDGTITTSKLTAIYHIIRSSSIKIT